jgi:hypothetical protein
LPNFSRKNIRGRTEQSRNVLLTHRHNYKGASSTLAEDNSTLGLSPMC